MFSHLSPFHFHSFSLCLYLSIHPSVRLSSISSLYFPSKSVGNGVVYLERATDSTSFLSQAARRLVLQHRVPPFPAIRKRVLPARKHHRPRSLVLFFFAVGSASQVVSGPFPEFQGALLGRFQVGWKNGATLLCLVCLLNDDGGSLSFFFVPLYSLSLLSLRIAV